MRDLIKTGLTFVNAFHKRLPVGKAQGLQGIHNASSCRKHLKMGIKTDWPHNTATEP